MSSVFDMILFMGVLVLVAAAGIATRSRWVRISVGCFYLTVAFVVFYGALPSALIAWTDNWGIVQDNPNFGPRIRDVGIMGYHGAIVGLTFYLFAIWQRMRPVNADADELKREAGGYR